MNEYKYAKFDVVPLKGHPVLNEKWVQARIADDPSILGLGDLILKDRERRQPHAGRLDLLLQDSDSGDRFEVEIQLGRTDESHIIRTIEYWDIEKKRYPQYDHTAVIVAENVTSRFLNVIGLFNGVIPLVALQMNALKWQDHVTLVFTKVLDQMTLGFEEEEEESDVADRAYWNKRGTPATVAVVDQALGMVHSFAPQFELKYNKFYIGLAVNGQANNFVLFKPKKRWLRAEFKMPRTEEIEAQIEQAGLDLIDYSKWGRYLLRLNKEDLKKHEAFLIELMKKAYSESGS
ncbi:MAG: hypothetical protein JSW50_06465 [Candidatus Latescibacterota bacterium]|nr:MAG: hypothetical protein JSW50_06465 [Candidatus Latescibacterota bacterium]